ncbi:MAG: hypothetical protein ACKOWX_01590 [Flavobacteriales bacterium]
MKLIFRLFILSLLPSLLLAQSKKEEILLLNTRIDSLTLVCNKLGAEKAALQKEQTKLQEECASEKSLLQNELSATQKQLQSVKKTFQSERELRLQISEQKRKDSLNFVAEIVKLQAAQALAQESKSLNGTYYNSKNQTFTISNNSVGESFDFSFKYGVQDEWGCLFETEGSAKLLVTADNAPNEVTYYVGEDAEYPFLKFTIIDFKTIQIWADSEWIGMDCAKFGASQEQTYTKFVRR